MRKRGRKPKESPEGIRKEPIEVVDENCEPLGVFSRGLVHTNGLYHKSVHVFIFNNRGEIFLQRRALDREENPGLWSSSASGHVSPGEPSIVAAQRELKEELKIKVKLEEVLRIPPHPETNWECSTLFVGKTDKQPKPNPNEVLEGRFFTIGELEKMIAETPEIFSPAFLFLWKLYKEKTPQLGS